MKYLGRTLKKERSLKGQHEKTTLYTDIYVTYKGANDEIITNNSIITKGGTHRNITSDYQTLFKCCNCILESPT